MQREARSYLFDMQHAAALIVQFTVGQSIESYLHDVMLRAAVEREFEIIGEALSPLSRLDPALAERITDYRGIIGLRNVLIHGYASINNRLVWGAVEDHLPILRRELDELLAEP